MMILVGGAVGAGRKLPAHPERLPFLCELPFQLLWGFRVLKNKPGGAGDKLPPRLALPLQTARILLGENRG